MITGGFGMTINFEQGTKRRWYMDADGVKRWDDTGELVEVEHEAEVTMLDELYSDAEKLVKRSDLICISNIQRQLRIGYNRA